MTVREVHIYVTWNVLYSSPSPSSLSIAAVFFVTVLMFGLNIWAAAILMLVVCMIILHMFGCMHLLGINANAVSLVNLVMVSRAAKNRMQ